MLGAHRPPSTPPRGNFISFLLHFVCNRKRGIFSCTSFASLRGKRIISLQKLGRARFGLTRSTLPHRRDPPDRNSPLLVYIISRSPPRAPQCLRDTRLNHRWVNKCRAAARTAGRDKGAHVGTSEIGGAQLAIHSDRRDKLSLTPQNNFKPSHG